MTDVQTKPKIDIAAIGALIAADIASRYGHKVSPHVKNATESRDGAYGHLEIEQTFGIFAMIIKTAKVSLRAEPVSDGTTWVLVSLSYDHLHGGSNGCNIGAYWLRDGAIENFREG